MLSSNEVNYTDDYAQGKNFFKKFSYRRSVPRCRHKRNVPKCQVNHGNANVLAPTDTMTQSEGTETTGAPARDRGSGLRQCC